MAKFSKEVSKAADGKEVVRYKDGENYVGSNTVPEAVKKALEGAKAGTVVDELGEKFDARTDIDESEDEKAPEQKSPNRQVEQEDTVEDAKPAQKPAKPAKPAAKKDDTTDSEVETPEEKKAREDREEAERMAAEELAAAQDLSNAGAPQSDPGMGFPRDEESGKTLSIFSKRPHETVKLVAGVTVPLTLDEYNTKTDSEIIVQLKKMKKL